MIKPILFSATILLFISCGSTNTNPPVEPTPTRAETLPENVDGTADVKDSLPPQALPDAEKAIDLKDKEQKPSTAPAKTKDTKTEAKAGKPTLHGSWVLEKIYGAKEPFKILFPTKTPNITFDLKENTVSGNNGCNSYNGPFRLKNGVLTISDLMSTRMFCEGVKEQLFMTTLKMTNSYKIDENGKLILLLDEEPLMGFKAK